MCFQVLFNRSLLTTRCHPCYIAALSVSYVLCMLCYFMDIYLDSQARLGASSCAGLMSVTRNVTSELTGR